MLSQRRRENMDWIQLDKLDLHTVCHKCFQPSCLIHTRLMWGIKWLEKPQHGRIWIAYQFLFHVFQINMTCTSNFVELCCWQASGIAGSRDQIYFQQALECVYVWVCVFLFLSLETIFWRTNLFNTLWSEGLHHGCTALARSCDANEITCLLRDSAAAQYSSKTTPHKI